MDLGERCDEIVRLIDEALAAMRAPGVGDSAAPAVPATPSGGDESRSARSPVRRVTSR